MRTKALRGLVAGLCLMGAASAAQAGGISWMRSLPSAMTRAKQTHKLVMIDFYADWCGWCKRLDQTTYTDAHVVKMMGQFIPVKLDSDHEGHPAAMKYGVQGLPTILFLNAAGEVEGRITGYLAAPGFTGQLQQILQSHREFPQMVARYKAHPNDTTLALKLAQTYVTRGSATQAAAILDRVGSRVPASAKGSLAMAYIQVGSGLAQQRQLNRAIPYFRKAAGVSTNPDERASARMSVAVCYLLQKQLKAAIPELKAAANQPGASPQIKQQAQAVLGKVQEQMKSSPRSKKR
jgi:thiol-disulfide isomerase/thioredoxin